MDGRYGTCVVFAYGKKRRFRFAGRGDAVFGLKKSLEIYATNRRRCFDLWFDGGNRERRVELVDHSQSLRSAGVGQGV